MEPLVSEIQNKNLVPNTPADYFRFSTGKKVSKLMLSLVVRGLESIAAGPKAFRGFLGYKKRYRN